MKIRLDVYAILTDAVESGVAYGHSRAYKYADEPTRETINEAIVDAVMNAISEKIQFPDFHGENLP